MARIPNADLEQLKNEVSVQRLVEASGVALRKGGKDFTGKCPFHPDDTASLVITPHKNLWHCFGCQIGGGPIDWVMKLRGVSFRHAVELLKEEINGNGGGGGVGLSGSSSLAAGLPAGQTAPVKRTTVRSLPAPVAFDANDQALLAQTVGYYHQRLQSSPEARAYLASRGLDHPGLVESFQLGVADRTLGLGLPQKNRADGAAIRARLQKLGILRESGHEHFNGSLVVPVFDTAGAVTEIYGRKLRDDLRQGTPKHLYLPGPREQSEPPRTRGVFNLAGVVAAGARSAGEREVILCEALLDAMTFWVHGFTHVTSSYGIEGFTDDILAAFRVHRIERVLIAYDRDAPGDKAAAKLAPVLIEAGFEVLRVLFPLDMDANSYATQAELPVQALALVLRQAQWLGGVRAVEVEVALEVEPSQAAMQQPSPLAAAPQAPKTYEQNMPPAQVLSAQAAPKNIVNTAPAATATPTATPTATDLPDELQLTTGQGLASLSWRIRGWKKNLTPEAMRVNVQVRHADAVDEKRPAAAPGRPKQGTAPSGGSAALASAANCAAPGAVASVGATFSAAGYFVDTLDLFAARSRQAFVRAASVELGLSEDALKRDLGVVLLQLETLQDALMAQARKPSGPTVPILSADEEAAALALLRAPDLMERIVADLHALGVVGEDTNLLAAYLAAVSRKLDTPLAVLIQSTSAAGKSALMDAVLSLMPEEQTLRYSAMTGQSLYYLGENNLSHKILAISEEEGVRQAAYALKLLQSEGTLTIASTAKDEQTGNLVTKQYSVRGPVMLMLTTTAIDVDEELLNRCLVLSVNESREQTAAIHARQRHKQTLAGLLQGADKASITALHHNAQRLLSSVAVVNPYADRLSFLSDKTRTRRDHMKYLTLIRAIALLHQHQREVKTVVHRGKDLAYIEVTKADIALANSIAHQVLGRTLDELPPQTRNLLVLLRTWCQSECAARALRQSDWRFTRKALRDTCHWGDTQLKVHLGRLVEFEHMLVHRRGLQCEYELVYDANSDAGQDGAHMNGLLDASTLEETPSQPIRHPTSHSTSHAYDASRSGLQALRSGSGRPLVGAPSGPCRGGVDAPPGRAGSGFAGHAGLNGFETPSTGHSSGHSFLAAGPVVPPSLASLEH